MRIIRHILAPTDFSPHATHALAFGVGLARDFGADLTLLHAVESWADRVRPGREYELEPEVAERVREQARRELEKFDTTGIGAIDLQATVGPAWKAICQLAETAGIDLIVLGTHGASALEHALLGSTSERVLRLAPCSVYTVRLPEHRVVLPYIGG